VKRGQNPNPFRQFVSEQARLFQSAKKVSAVKPDSIRSKVSKDAPCALIFSPHPDDECITGGLPLRLLREAKCKIVNVAVTAGSNRERQSARVRELKNACSFLGFDLTIAGFKKINLQTRKENPAQWKLAVKTVSQILAEQKPRAIFLPHESDDHPTHIGTHFLVLDALKKLPRGFETIVIETEFWKQMANPNLLVESSVDDVADLVAALSLHVGEVKRNPYHARLPAWMMDNVRRGAEVIGKCGGAAPDFVFGTVYRLQKWRDKKLQPSSTGKFLSAKANPLKLWLRE